MLLLTKSFSLFISHFSLTTIPQSTHHTRCPPRLSPLWKNVFKVRLNINPSLFSQLHKADQVPMGLFYCIRCQAAYQKKLRPATPERNFSFEFHPSVRCYHHTGYRRSGSRFIWFDAKQRKLVFAVIPIRPGAFYFFYIASNILLFCKNSRPGYRQNGDFISKFSANNTSLFS